MVEQLDGAAQRAEVPPKPGAARDDRITLRFMSTPADAAAGGRSIAAGSVMEWIDKAAYACAVGWSGAYCVTAYVGNVRHKRPIPPGSIVEVHARIIHTGRSSMHVITSVLFADVQERAFQSATTCVLIFVAKDADGRPTAVPAWEPATDSDRQLAAAAQDRIPARDAIKRCMLAAEYGEETGAPETKLRFLAPPGAVNWGGKAHGGTVMRWIDEAAYACAASWMRDGGTSGASDAVAVYSGGIHFFAPVKIGDLVDVEARLLLTTNRSLHIGIRVLTADPRTPRDRTLTTQCVSVFVAPGSDGRATPVPAWRPALAGDIAMDAHARELIELRTHVAAIPTALVLAP